MLICFLERKTYTIIYKLFAAEITYVYTYNKFLFKLYLPFYFGDYEKQTPH